MKKYSFKSAARKASVALAVMALCSVMGSAYAGNAFPDQKEPTGDRTPIETSDLIFVTQSWKENGLQLSRPGFKHYSSTEGKFWGDNAYECSNADTYATSLKASANIAYTLYENDKILAAKIGNFSGLRSEIKAIQQYKNSLQVKAQEATDTTEAVEEDINSGTVVGALNALEAMKANKDMDNLTNTGKLNVKKLAQEAISIKGEGAATVTNETASDGSKTTYTVKVDKSGTVAKGDTNLVTGDTVYNAIQKTLGNGGTGATVDLSDTNYAKTATSAAEGVKLVDAQLKTTDDKVGDNQYTSTNYVTSGASSTAAISALDAQLKATDDKVGDNQYTSTNYVTSGASSTAAISALDTALKATDDKINTVEGKLTTLDSGKANTSLDNLSTDGEAKVKSLAQDAIDVTGEGAVTVNSATKDGKKTYTVSVATDGVVAEGNTGIVTGGTVYTATKALDDKIATEAAAREEADKTLQNKIEAVDTKVGDNQYSSENYVKKGSSSTDAIGALDSALATEASERQAADAMLNNRLTKLGDRVDKVGAGAAALAALHPLDFDPDDKFSFAVGYGNYAGQNAAAIGAFYRPDEKVMFNVAGSLGNGENMVNAGISFALDRTSKTTTSKAAMARKIAEQDEKLAAQEAKIARLEAMIQQLAAK